jgi:hypothetical protein
MERCAGWAAGTLFGGTHVSPNAKFAVSLHRRLVSVRKESAGEVSRPVGSTRLAPPHGTAVAAGGLIPIWVFSAGLTEIAHTLRDKQGSARAPFAGGELVRK